MEHYEYSARPIDHYAAIARVLRESTLQYVTNDDTAAVLAASRSAKDLRWNFIDSMTSQVHAVLHSDAFVDIHRGLQQSQSERSAMHWHLIEESLEAGIHTFINTTETIYDVLAKNLSPDVADSPDSFVLLDRLAKLNINQFIPYRSVYLDTSANHKRFLEHLQPYNTGMSFKPRFPLEAKVPTVLAAANALSGAEAFDLENNPLIRITDIPEERVTIGCPITFYAGQVKELWSLYAGERRSLRQRQELGCGALEAANSDDNAASP
jgi:hypothetical protein